MKATALAAILLGGCASVQTQPGYASRTDVDCGLVASNGGHMFIRLRQGIDTPPALLTCGEAVRYVALGLLLGPVPAETWTVIFTGGAPGWVPNERDDLRPVATLGMTYANTRTIMVSALHPYIIRHELFHAVDVENGRPNDRDAVREIK